MRFNNLPNWNITSEQPGFYDVESGTAIQQTARLYKRIQELINDYNNFVNEIENDIETQNTIITNTKDYMEDNLIDTAINILNKGLNDDLIKVKFVYNEDNESLTLYLKGEVV